MQTNSKDNRWYRIIPYITGIPLYTEEPNQASGRDQVQDVGVCEAALARSMRQCSRCGRDHRVWSHPRKGRNRSWCNGQ